jgi:hypothetical protein
LKFRYLGIFRDLKNLISNEIKWIAAGNRCYCSLRQTLSLEPRVKQLKLRYINDGETNCSVWE